MKVEIRRALAQAALAAALGAMLALWLAPFTVDPAPGFHPEAETPSIGPAEPAPPALAGTLGGARRA